jgi:hypothetical protein
MQSAMGDKPVPLSISFDLVRPEQQIFFDLWFTKSNPRN